MGLMAASLAARVACMQSVTLMTTVSNDYDVLIIGSGAAGLTAALTLATRLRVLVLAKGKLTSGSTARAGLPPCWMQVTPLKITSETP